MIEFLPFTRPAALFVPPLVALALWLWIRRRRRVARALGDAPLLSRLLDHDLAAVPRVRVALVMAAALAMAGALADPGRTPGRGGASARGGPVVLVLDVSNSMLAEDVPPSRLSALRAAAGRMVRGLPGTPVGLVVFAGRAYALAPPTVDPSALELYLDALDPQMVTQSGSSLSGAVRQAVSLLASTRDRSGTVVLLSDGNANESADQIAEAARLARRAGVPIYTGGIGTPGGAPVPDVDFRTGQRVGFKRDPAGQTILSRLDEELLRGLARETGGEYLQLVTPAQADLLLESVRTSVSGAGEGGESGGPTRYAWFALAALVLLTLEGGLSRAWPRRAP